MKFTDYEGLYYKKVTQALNSCSNLKLLKLNKIKLCCENDMVNTVAELKKIQALQVLEVSNGVAKKLSSLLLVLIYLN